MEKELKGIKLTVLEIIHRNRQDTEVRFGVPERINTSAVMYSYGGLDEFRKIIAELEETYGIELDDEIGEMTVQAFVDLVTTKVNL